MILSTANDLPGYEVIGEVLGGGRGEAAADQAAPGAGLAPRDARERSLRCL
jgi:hypothetical protein